MNKVLFVSFFFLYILLTPVAYSAQYRVVELPVADLGQSTFPSAINNTGEITVNVDYMYNAPIDTTLIDFESIYIYIGLENYDGVRGGDISDTDYAFLYQYIYENAGNQFFQQIADWNSYLATDEYSDPLRGFDTIDPNTDDYRNSVTTQVRSINEFGYTVGVSQDGFYTVDYVSESTAEATFVVNDFYSRAFAQVDGDIIELAPPATSAGGFSDAYDINVQNQVVGYGTTEFTTDAYDTAAESCTDPDARGDVPLESCLRSIYVDFNNNVSSVAQQRGLIWQLDEKGNVIDTYTLGMLVTPSDSSSSIYTSTAVAINDFGIAVGQSPAYYQDTSSLTTAAAIYDGDDVLTINEDDDVFSSIAYDINNDGLVVGNITKSVNGSTRNKFFVHSMDADKTIYPDDFFEGSSSVALSINDESMVVGYGEDEASLTTRRTQGFIYDYKNDIFQGLNDLIECNSPYTIVQANAINDNNEIAATALIKGVQKNLRGEVVLDEFGAEIEIDQIVAVKLEPISGGSIDNCDAYEEEVVRQGASLYWLLGLIMLTGALRIRERSLFN